MPWGVKYRLSLLVVIFNTTPRSVYRYILVRLSLLSTSSSRRCRITNINGYNACVKLRIELNKLIVMPRVFGSVTGVRLRLSV